MFYWKVFLLTYLQTVSDEIVAQAHMENVAVKLFNWADTEDRHKRYNKWE